MEFQQEASAYSNDSDESGSPDPLYEQVDWTPLVSGGANFRTHKLKKAGYHTYQAVPTIGYVLFTLVFVLGGAGTLTGAYFLLEESLFSSLFVGGIGLLFFALGVFLMRQSMKPFTIDLDMGVFYKGSSYDPYALPDDDTAGSIRDIHALQLLSEHISGSKSNYTSYEMNLVLKDGRRVNVMDHGNPKKLQKEAVQLSEALDIPIWSSPA